MQVTSNCALRRQPRCTRCERTGNALPRVIFADSAWRPVQSGPYLPDVNGALGTMSNAESDGYQIFSEEGGR